MREIYDLMVRLEAGEDIRAVHADAVKVVESYHMTYQDYFDDDDPGQDRPDAMMDDLCRACNDGRAGALEFATGAKTEFGAEEGSYQGALAIILRRESGEVAAFVDGFGSCSYCDDFQRAQEDGKLLKWARENAATLTWGAPAEIVAQLNAMIRESGSWDTCEVATKAILHLGGTPDPTPEEA